MANGFKILEDRVKERIKRLKESNDSIIVLNTNENNKKILDLWIKICEQV